jgi:hypothetical protein
MGKITYLIKVYTFYKPHIISEKEFLIFKEIFNENPKYSITPKNAFWQEFKIEMWGLFLIIIFKLLSLKWKEFEFLFLFGIFVVIIGLFQGTGSSMESYFDYIRIKNKYYKDLKTTIINSKDYNEFVLNASKL